MKKICVLFAMFALLLSSCSKNDDEPVVNEKTARLEVNISGSYSEYMLVFQAINFIKGTNESIEPVIISPNVEWTEVVQNGYSFTLERDPLDFNTLVIESKEPVNSAGFGITATHVANQQGDNFEPLKAVITFKADGKTINTYEYNGVPPGQGAPFMVETLKF